MKRRRSHIVARWLIVAALAVLSGGSGWLTSATVGATTVGCDPDVLVSALNALSATSPPATFDLTAGCVYDFTTPADYFFGPNALPTIQSNVTIHGHGATLARSTRGNMRLRRVREPGLHPHRGRGQHAPIHPHHRPLPPSTRCHGHTAGGR